MMGLLDFIKETIQLNREYYHEEGTQENRAKEAIASEDCGHTPTSTQNGPKIYMTPFYHLAAKVIFDTQQASVSMIQRRLQLGYSKAAKIVDYFEECGMIGPFMGSAPRKILISRQEYDKRVKIVDNLPIVDIDRIIQDEAKWRKKQAGPTDAEAELEKVDGMDGHQFEHWCADLLKKNGFTNVEVTPGSGDQGVDVLAEKGGIKFAVQCKCYSSDLGNKPVQEVNTGKGDIPLSDRCGYDQPILHRRSQTGGGGYRRPAVGPRQTLEMLKQ